MKNLLVLSPHTDDETLGCGGFIKKFTDSGGRVFVAIFSHGGAGIKWNGTSYKEYCNNTRLKEFYSALSILGVSSEDVFRFQTEEVDHIHHKLDVVPLGSLISFIENCIKKIGVVETILTPFKGYDQDHEAVNKATLAACRPHFFNGTVLEYSVGSESTFTPNVFVTLNRDLLDVKQEAFSKYVTQKVNDSHPLSKQQVENQARRFGSLVAHPFAEGFVCNRVIINE